MLSEAIQAHDRAGQGSREYDAYVWTGYNHNGSCKAILQDLRGPTALLSHDQTLEPSRPCTTQRSKPRLPRYMQALLGAAMFQDGFYYNIIRVAGNPISPMSSI